MVRHAPSQSLGGSAQERGGGTAKDEKPSRLPAAVRQDPQHREEVGTALDLVEDDESAQPLEGKHGVRQRGFRSRIFEVEPRRRPLPRVHDLAGERRLADLTGAEQGDHRGPAQEARHTPAVALPFEHGGNLPRNSDTN